MSFKDVPTGKEVPNNINVIIEIPADSPPVKYEIDKDSDALFVDRFITTAMYYPCNYGYIPHTLSEDGDPVDVLVITPIPLLSGSVVRARPIGMLKMSDDAGIDVKVLAVPISKLTKEYDHIQNYTDIPAGLLKKIEHFFAHYKDNEAGKWTKLEGWVDATAAKAEILAGVERAKK
jgi:inorganic pyrophosphatase